MIESIESRLKEGRVATLRLAVPADAQAITDLVNLVGSEKEFMLREHATWTPDKERKTLAAADGREGALFFMEIDGRLCGLLNIARGRWPKNAHVAEFGMSCGPDCRGVGLGAAFARRALAVGFGRSPPGQPRGLRGTRS